MLNFLAVGSAFIIWTVNATESDAFIEFIMNTVFKRIKVDSQRALAEELFPSVR